MNVNEDMQEISYPVVFLSNICPHCGNPSLLFTNSKNETTKNLIYSVNNIKCSNCKTDFFIKWITDPENEKKMKPVPIAFNIIDKFENDILGYYNLIRRKL